METTLLRTYVDGIWASSAAEELLEVHNPATDEVVAGFPSPQRRKSTVPVWAAGPAFEDWRPRHVGLKPKMLAVTLPISGAITSNAMELEETGERFWRRCSEPRLVPRRNLCLMGTMVGSYMRT